MHNAERMGQLLRQELSSIPQDIVSVVRGKVCLSVPLSVHCHNNDLVQGLLNAIVINPKFDAWDVCLKFRDNGVLAKPTHGDKIRLAPPLVIDENQIRVVCDIIRNTLMNVARSF